MIETGLDPAQELEKRKKLGEESDRLVSDEEYDDEMSNDDFVVGGKR